MLIDWTILCCIYTVHFSTILLHNMLRLLWRVFFLINLCCCLQMSEISLYKCLHKKLARTNRFLYKLMMIIFYLIKPGYAVSLPCSFISGNCKNWLYYLRVHFKPSLKRITSTLNKFFKIMYGMVMSDTAWHKKTLLDHLLCDLNQQMVTYLS